MGFLLEILYEIFAILCDLACCYRIAVLECVGEWNMVY